MKHNPKSPLFSRVMGFADTAAAAILALATGCAAPPPVRPNPSDAAAIFRDGQRLLAPPSPDSAHVLGFARTAGERDAVSQEGRP
jgi:hypothetical protein